ncbi:MAG: hypothetical protein KBD46_02395 [Candidatus Levybacteria bacterium]|nr:hypothetical protein [Candidatus Levybacteria bacterium]
MEKQLQKGQVLLIVVLVMVVALTAGLSIASRSITNLRITSDDENSQRAFSAAEAGIERAVKGKCTDTNGCIISEGFEEGFIENNTTFETRITPISGTEFLVKGGVQVKQDEGSDVWLSQYSTDPALLYTDQWYGNLTVHWGDGSGACNNAAIQIMLLQGDKTNPSLTQFVYDPCARGNNFPLPDGVTETEVASQSFQYTANITIPEANKGLLMRIIPLYTNTRFALSGDRAFSVQGQLIVSTGRTGGNGSEATVRKVNFTQSYASVPSEFFQYVLISP